MQAGEQPCHTRVWRRFHGEQTQSNKSPRALEKRKRSWLEIESGGALVQSRVNTYLILLMALRLGAEVPPPESEEACVRVVKIRSSSY